MKKSLRFMLLSATLAGGGIILSGPLSVFASTLHPVQISLPAASIDLSDLDLRDNNNKPIKSAKAKQQMKALFVQGLNRLLMQNLTPNQRIGLKKMAQTWDVVSGWIKNGIQKVSTNFDAWIQRKKEVSFQKTTTKIDQTDLNPGMRMEVNQADGSLYLYFLSNFLSSTILLR